MKIFIDALNGHRAGEVIATALRLGFIKLAAAEIVYNREDAEYAIFYATNADNARAKANLALARKVPTLLLHDDLAIPDKHKDMVTVSAFAGQQNAMPFINCMYYSPFVTRPLKNTGKYDFVYGGTFKPSRLASYRANIPNLPTTLLIGDDTRWDGIAPLATRMRTIRDMSVLYDIMSTCANTFIALDEAEAAVGAKLPLRAIEPYICGMTDSCPISSESAKSVIFNLRRLLWAIQSA